MSDFSLFSLFTAGLVCFAPLASAWTTPTGSSPEGNPIYQPGLNSVVPAGKNFTVTWDPTTQGTVTLVLLKGPASNAVPQYAIAEKIENSGTFTWTPSKDLAPADTGYGLELIVDKTGQYQYTTQFGISNDDYHPGAASASWSSVLHSASSQWSSEYAAATKSLSAAYGSATSAWASATAAATTTASSATVTASANVTANATAPYPTTAVVASTGGVPANSSMVYPTGSMSVPSSLLTSASATGGSSSSGASGASATTSSGPAIQTGAAADMAASFAGLVVAAGVAVFAL